MARLPALLIALLLPAASAADAIVIAGLGGQPPLATIAADGRTGGLERRLTEALCAAMARDCRFVAAESWSDLVEGVRTERYDLGFGALSRWTVERLDLGASAVWLPLEARFAALEGAGMPVAPMLGPGLDIGVIRGSPHALWLEARLPESRLRRYAEGEELALSLQAGSVDVLFGDGLELWRTLVSQDMGIAFTGEPVAIDEPADGLVLALPPGSALREEVDRALRALAEDGTIDRLLAAGLPGFAP